MHRRCNYDVAVVRRACAALASEIDLRAQGYTSQMEMPQDGSQLKYYLNQYNRSGMADVVVFPYIINGHQTQYLSTEYMEKLLKIGYGMLEYQPFELVTIHDAFKAHPNNCNHVRYQYKEILAELAESNILEDILSQIHGEPGCFTKLSTNLGELIRESNYALS